MQRAQKRLWTWLSALLLSSSKARRKSNLKINFCFCWALCQIWASKKRLIHPHKFPLFYILLCILTAPSGLFFQTEIRHSAEYQQLLWDMCCGTQPLFLLLLHKIWTEYFSPKIISIMLSQVILKKLYIWWYITVDWTLIKYFLSEKSQWYSCSCYRLPIITEL